MANAALVPYPKQPFSLFIFFFVNLMISLSHNSIHAGYLYLSFPYFELNDDMIKKRIKPYNCNLINKPGLALSTMAASLNTNFDNMLVFWKGIMELLRPHCDMLNTKSLNEDKSPRTIEHAIGTLTDYISKT